jgi:hypothetical protein
MSMTYFVDKNNRKPPETNCALIHLLHVYAMTLFVSATPFTQMHVVFIYQYIFVFCSFFKNKCIHE